MPSITNIAAYKFANLTELKPLRERLADRCKTWKLKGTILLSTEGINLFVAGDQPEIDLLRGDPSHCSILETIMKSNLEHLQTP